MPLIKIDQVSKIFRLSDEVEVKALKNISFEIKKGEFVAIIGPSGSGKSTLMHILGALDSQTSGEYFLDGKNVAQLDEDQLAEIRNQKIGFVFQAFNLLPRTTALRNVAIPMMYAGLDKNKQVSRAKKLLELMGLQDRMTHLPNQLSGGQQQRVAIARALALNPSIILADEPTGNISGKHVDELMKVFIDLNKKGHTIIVITHEQEIAQYANRVLTLKSGQLVNDQAQIKKIKREMK
jgi:putative ABC transport system ATP-binding protein